MAGGAAAGILAAVTALGGLVSNQTRSGGSSGPGPRIDTSTAALAGATDRKQLKILERNARAERQLAVLTDPQVMGLLVTFGGLAAASRLPFHPDPDVNQRVQGVAAAAAVLMGLGRAGVGDLTTTAVAAAAGLAVGSDGGSLPLTITGPGGIPLVSAFGPLASLQWSYRKLQELT